MLRGRAPVYMPCGHSPVGGAGYTPSPNAPSGRQSALRSSLSTKTVTKRIALKCQNCEHEFDGLARHKEHYVESGSVLAKTIFDRALDDCAKCGSRMVVARTA